MISKKILEKMDNLILIIGKNGQLGTELVNILRDGSPFVALTHDDIEITNHEDVRERIKDIGPNIVINTSAFHNVDVCEQDPETSYAVNGLAVRNLAEICRDNGIKLVHLSTDYVFNGNSKEPYTEEDIALPVNVYGDSKLRGEAFVRGILPEYFIVRTAAIQGISKSSVKGSNFVETMLRKGREKGVVRVVSDQITSPTYAPDLARKILELAGTDNFGTYHMTSTGQVSWYDMARKIFELEGIKVETVPITTKQAAQEFNYKAQRPLFTVLDNKNLRGIGFEDLTSWRDTIEAYLQERRERIV